MIPEALVICMNESQRCRKRKDFRSLLIALQENLPKNCPILGCSSYHVIGENDKGDLHQCNNNHGGVSVLVVPKARGVTVDVLRFSQNEVERNGTSRESWIESLGDLPSKDMKFIFLLGKYLKMCEVVEGVKKVFSNQS